jgi:hypothetical protein
LNRFQWEFLSYFAAKGTIFLSLQHCTCSLY